MLIRVENQGLEILSTKFQKKPNANAWYLYLGVDRFQGLSPLTEREISDARTARQIVISQARWTDQHRDGVELLLFDGSPDPCLFVVDKRRCDWWLLAREQEQDAEFPIYTAQGKECPSFVGPLPSLS